MRSTQCDRIFRFRSTAGHVVPAAAEDSAADPSVIEPSACCASFKVRMWDWSSNLSENTRQRFLALSYSTIGGALSSMNLLMTKSIGSLILTFEFSKHSIAYVFVAALVVCNVSQIYWMQYALQRFDALVVVPVTQTVTSILSTLTGLIYFNEVNQLDLTSSIVFTTGFMFTLGGVALLTHRDVDTGANNTAAITVAPANVTTTAEMASIATDARGPNSPPNSSATAYARATTPSRTPTPQQAFARTATPNRTVVDQLFPTSP